mmetsp:Transcript_101830/g.164169  ORF Transcript_101830/g.164169 Transcript_101830/m.164169 type:complete len:81 (-) Transcript_101830:3087-3329(-)
MRDEALVESERDRPFKSYLKDACLVMTCLSTARQHTGTHTHAHAVQTGRKRLLMDGRHRMSAPMGVATMSRPHRVLATMS